MATRAIDFSDLGGKPVPSSGPIDFSDLGGKPVAASTGQNNPPETGVWAGVKRNTIGLVQGLYNAFTQPATDEEKQQLLRKVKEANAQGDDIPESLATNPSRATLAYHRLIDAPADYLEAKGSNERAAARDLMGHGEIWKGTNTYLSGL